MVHALKEIWRILTPEGILIDLRPISDRWSIEVSTRQKSWEAGRVTDSVVALADDAAADEAMADVSQAGWFALERKEGFDFFYYWDKPDEMQAYVSDRWEEYYTIPPEARSNLQVIWANIPSDSRVRIRLKMLISIWKKQSMR